MKVDLMGKQFDRLEVIGFHGLREDYKNREYFWICKCSCENETILLVRTSALNTGLTKSCGCLRLERLRAKDTREKMSKSHIEYMKDPEVRKRMSETQKNVWKDPIKKKNILDALHAAQSTPEYSEKQRIAQTGKKMSEESSIKKRDALIGKTRPREVGEKISKSLTGKKLSEEHKKSLKTPKLNAQGDKHYNWKGGISGLNNQVRMCYKYREWYRQVFRRDNYTCQNCKKKASGELNAHHIKFFSVIMKENSITTLEEALECKEMWDISNGVTLCVNCHKEVHSSNKDED